MKAIWIHFKKTSQPHKIEGKIRNCYEKGSFYCIMYEDGTVDKFPIRDIFRVREFGAKDDR